MLVNCVNRTLRRSFSSASAVGMLTLLAWLILALLPAWSSFAFARADGPDVWDISGVTVGSTVRLHAAPSLRSAVVKHLPHDSQGLENLGCKAGRQTSTGARPSDARWCKVRVQGVMGWISGRYLVEGQSARKPLAPGRTSVGAWRVDCDAGECAVEQTAGVGPATTTLRIEPRPANNARFVITRAGIPETGVLSIAMDGEMISAGPIAPLRAGSGQFLVFPPDDVTLGLLTQMTKRRKLVLAISSDEKSATFDLGRFTQALQMARRLAEGSRR